MRFAFDGDAVLFSEDSEVVYKNEGLHAFHAAEDASRSVPLPAGPFAGFLMKLARLKESLPDRPEYSPVRIAVVTARNQPAAQRVITTLRAWKVYVDEAFFLGGLRKDKVVAAFRPHIFFDDQEIHVLPASGVVPAGRVPYRTGSPLQDEARPAAEPADQVPLSRSPADTPVTAAKPQPEPIAPELPLGDALA
jgi:5'-nucleotidase